MLIIFILKNALERSEMKDTFHAESSNKNFTLIIIIIKLNAL
jgi:hypothetical protein